jgi:DinB superfamily
MMDQPVCSSLWSKIEEQINRTDHLISMLPEGGAHFLPPIPGAWTIGGLLGHLLDCLAGLSAVLHAAHPEQLAHFQSLRDIPVNQHCESKDARARIAIYRAHIEEGFGVLTDADLGRRIPTIFVPGGETVATLLLGNLEHVINHKHQLFTYLKFLDVAVGTSDLYSFRGR